MQNASTLGSVNLGRYNGLPIRLHISYLLVGVFVFFFRIQAGGDPLGNTGFILLIWLACVLVHEMGHCLTVKQIGGTNEMLVLTPFGGLSFQSFPQQAGKDLWVALSGPLLSFLGFAVAAGGLYILDDDPMAGPLSVDKSFFSASALVVGLRLAVWINLGLTVFNLLPTIPFDGGWILHALIWPSMGDQRAWHIVRKASLATAVGILFLAITMEANGLSIGNVPLWLPLTIVAVYCFCFSAVPLSVPPGPQLGEPSNHESVQSADRLSQHIETYSTEDDPQLLDTFPSAEQTLFSPATEQDQHQQADSAVDDVLQCVHDRGLASLTQAQRKVLQEAAVRYRSRSPK